MDAPLILADRLLQVIRESGASKLEAHSALSIAETALTAIPDISFRHDVPEPTPQSP